MADLTGPILSQAMGGALSSARYAVLAAPVTAALRQAHCTTVKRAAMFLAQVGHESGGLMYMEEIASGAAYEGRADLGNVQPGDGRRFKGRGPLQITGRSNYTKLSQWAHGKGYVPTAHYFVDHPAKLATDQYGFLGAVWFWTIAHNLNSYADRADVEGATLVINGGLDKLPERKARWRTCRALGSAIVPGIDSGADDGGVASDAIRTTGKGTPLPADVVWTTQAKVPFRGGFTCSCATQVIGLAEALLIERGVIKECLDFWQFGYSTAVAASGDTHSAGGVADTKQHNDETIRAIREAGAAGWLRDQSHGGFTTTHCHFVVDGCPHASNSAKDQVTAYRNGRDGLLANGHSYGPNVSPRTYRQALAQLTSGPVATLTGTPTQAKPKKFRRRIDYPLKRSKSFHSVPITDDGTRYACATGPGTIFVTANITTDKPCWARVITADKNGSTVVPVTKYPRVRIQAGGDQLYWWDTIGGPAKGFTSRIVRIQLLAYASDVVMQDLQVRAGRE